MPEFYHKPVEKIIYQDGQKYIHENVFKIRVGNLLGTIERHQKVRDDHEKFLLKLLDNKIISLLFAKQIRKQIQKHDHIEINF